ncbi:large ribosomal subunit protein mL53-like [Asterias amurensis]|uniref:large ribosomal subunit protein mL53-like n=1 Tax=Asterias amurensis TaxID=7602 RepID=UPI003AB6AB61
MPAVVKHVTLKFIKSIMVEFCPWEANAQSARQFLSRVRSGPVTNTNPKCLVKSKVKHDGSDPAITVLFDDGKQVLFKSSCLSSIEVLQRLGSFNKQREKAELSATES